MDREGLADEVGLKLRSETMIFPGDEKREVFFFLLPDFSLDALEWHDNAQNYGRVRCF